MTDMQKAKEFLDAFAIFKNSKDIDDVKNSNIQTLFQKKTKDIFTDGEFEINEVKKWLKRENIDNITDTSSRSTRYKHLKILFLRFWFNVTSVTGYKKMSELNKWGVGMMEFTSTAIEEDKAYTKQLIDELKKNAASQQKRNNIYIQQELDSKKTKIENLIKHELKHSVTEGQTMEDVINTMKDISKDKKLDNELDKLKNEAKAKAEEEAKAKAEAEAKAKAEAEAEAEGAGAGAGNIDASNTMDAENFTEEDEEDLDEKCPDLTKMSKMHYQSVLSKCLENCKALIFSFPDSEIDILDIFKKYKNNERKGDEKDPELSTNIEKQITTEFLRRMQDSHTHYELRKDINREFKLLNNSLSNFSSLSYKGFKALTLMLVIFYTFQSLYDMYSGDFTYLMEKLAFIIFLIYFPKDLVDYMKIQNEITEVSIANKADMKSLLGYLCELKNGCKITEKTILAIFKSYYQSNADDGFYSKRIKLLEHIHKFFDNQKIYLLKSENTHIGDSNEIENVTKVLTTVFIKGRLNDSSSNKSEISINGTDINLTNSKDVRIHYKHLLEKTAKITKINIYDNYEDSKDELLISFRDLVKECHKSQNGDESLIYDRFNTINKILYTYKILKLPEYEECIKYLFQKNLLNRLNDIKKLNYVKTDRLIIDIQKNFIIFANPTIDSPSNNLKVKINDCIEKDSKFNETFTKFVEHLQTYPINKSFLEENKFIYNLISEQIEDYAELYNVIQIHNLFNDIINTSTIKNKKVLSTNFKFIIDQIYTKFDKKNDYDKTNELLLFNDDKINKIYSDKYISFLKFKHKFKKLSNTQTNNQLAQYTVNVRLTNKYITDFNNNLDETKNQITTNIRLNDKYNDFLTLYFRISSILMFDYILTSYYGEENMVAKKFDNVYRKLGVDKFRNAFNNQMSDSTENSVDSLKKTATQTAKQTAKGAKNVLAKLNPFKKQKGGEEDVHEEQEEQEEKEEQEENRYIKASIVFSFWLLTYKLLESYWTKQQSNLNYNKIITIDNTSKLETEVNNLEMLSDNLTSDDQLKKYYKQLIICLELYEKCNFVADKFKSVPFPASEITTNVTILIACVLVLAAVYYNSNPYDTHNKFKEIAKLKKEITELEEGSVTQIEKDVLKGRTEEEKLYLLYPDAKEAEIQEEDGNIIKINSFKDFVNYRKIRILNKILKKIDKDPSITLDNPLEYYVNEYDNKIKDLEKLISNDRNGSKKQEIETEKRELDVTNMNIIIEKSREYRDKLMSGGADKDMLTRQILKIQERKRRIAAKISFLKKDGTFMNVTMSITILMFTLYMSLQITVNSNRYTSMLYSGTLFRSSNCV